MNPIKFLMIILIITAIASVYVHQQTRIVQLAYQEQERLAYLRNLLDENKSLKYRIDQRTSLISIAKICPIDDFEWPHGKQLASLPSVWGFAESDIRTDESAGILSGLFRLKSQAEATPVEPR
ncbi:MAG: hypothetical protein ABIH40_00600 [Candidatus Omnitrophota bacterium]